MTDLTREHIEALLDGATQGPWQADGEPWNRIVWSSAENRVCFMAHSNGLDDARDIATSNLVAAAPDLARQLLATMTALAEAQAAQAVVVSSAFEAGAKAVHDEWVRAHQAGEIPPRGEPDFSEAASDYASLADPTGVKLLEEVRAERDALAADGAGVFWAEKARAFAMQMASVDARAKDAEAERDAADRRAGAMLTRVAALEADGEAARARVRDLNAQLAEAQKREACLREALNLADDALTEAEAILGGEYGDHYGPLCETMLDLRNRITALSAAPTGEESQ